MSTFTYIVESDIFLMVWIVLMFVFAEYVNVKATETVNGKEVRRYTDFFAVIVFIPIFCRVVFSTADNDVPLYLKGFYELESGLGDIFSLPDEYSENYGFTILQIIIKSVFGDNGTAFRAVVALIQSIPLVYLFRKYSDNYLFTVYLFIASTSYQAWMMNGIRQFVAVTLIMLTTPLILKKKYIPTIIIILLVSTIHQSAIVMIPAVIIANMKPWKRKTLILIILLSIVIYIYANQTLVENDVTKNDDGAHPLRVLLNAVPMVITFLGREKIKEENDGFLNLCVNMSVITTAVYFIAMLTSGVVVGRVPIYMSLYGYIALPKFIELTFVKKDIPLVYTAIAGVYFIYFGLYFIF